jgi:hypothetical protein
MSSGGVSRSSIAAPIWIFIFQQYFHPQKVVLGTHVVYDVIGKNITSNFTDLSQTIPPSAITAISVVPPPISTIMFPLAA